jgi:hypothetical protein
MYLLPCDQKWGGKPLEFLMQNHSPVEKPSVELGIGSALAQVDFSRSPSSNNANKFGLEGMAILSKYWSNMEGDKDIWLNLTIHHDNKQDNLKRQL